MYGQYGSKLEIRWLWQHHLVDEDLSLN